MPFWLVEIGLGRVRFGWVIKGLARFAEIRSNRPNSN